MTAWWARARERWDGIFVDDGDARPYGLTRALFGGIVIVHLWDVLGPALDGRTYHDRFHIPFWSWLPDPSPATYTALLWLGVVAGALMIVGLGSRVATPVACAVVATNVLLDQTGFHHNRAFLIYVLFGLSFVPTDRALALDAVIARRRGRPRSARAPLWGVWLTRALAVMAYLGSGISKVLDPDWRSGLVNQARIARSTEHLVGLPFDDQLIDLLTSRTFHAWFTPVILATELFIGVGLWFRRTRVAAVWAAVAFHLSIEIGASVQVFSLAGIAALTIWVTPAEAVAPLTRRTRRRHARPAVAPT